LLGRFNSQTEGIVAIPSNFSNIGKITLEASATASVFVTGISFKPVLTNASAVEVAPETVGYTLTDSTGDSSSATLTLNVISNTIIGDSANNSFGGTAANDMLEGLDGNDALTGLAGNDILMGGNGNDTLYGGTGKDVLDGGLGANALYGEAGNDKLTFHATDTAVDGGTGIDTMILTTNASIDFSLLNTANNTINDIEIIDLKEAGDHNITAISLQDVLDITENKQLTILGDGSDSVTLQTNTAHNDWVKDVSPVTEVVNGASHTFNVYTNTTDPTVTVKVEQTIDQHLV
jgi:hypothetical protein